MTSIDHSLLTWILLLPAFGAVVAALLPERGKLVQTWALLVALATFVLTLHLPAHFDYNHTGFQFEINRLWIVSPPIHYHLGIDGLSVWLVVLTGFLAPIGVLASWRAIDTRVKEFYSLFLLQQTAMLGVFLALDMMVYYAFWELSLVPMAILIAMFGRDPGSRNSSRAAIKFFLYTFIPSALFLVGILALYARTGTFDYRRAEDRSSPRTPRSSRPAAMWVISLSFLVAFAVKVPVFPSARLARRRLQRSAHRHGDDRRRQAWPLFAHPLPPRPLPLRVPPRRALDDHAGRPRHPLWRAGRAGAERPQAPARLRHPLEPQLLHARHLHLRHQWPRWRRLSHPQRIHHRRRAAGPPRRHVRALRHLRDRALRRTRRKTPRLATLFVVTVLALIGLPILNGFVGEFLTLSSGFATSHVWGALGTVGVILSAAYMLWMVQRVFYGPESPLVHRSPAHDLAAREHLALWPMAILMVIMGVASPYWIRAIDRGVHALSNAPALTHPAAALASGHPHDGEGQ